MISAHIEIAPFFWLVSGFSFSFWFFSLFHLYIISIARQVQVRGVHLIPYQYASNASLRQVVIFTAGRETFESLHVHLPAHLSIIHVVIGGLRVLGTAQQRRRYRKLSTADQQLESTYVRTYVPGLTNFQHTLYRPRGRDRQESVGSYFTYTSAPRYRVDCYCQYMCIAVE